MNPKTQALAQTSITDWKAFSVALELWFLKINAGQGVCDRNSSRVEI